MRQFLKIIIPNFLILFYKKIKSKKKERFRNILKQQGKHLSEHELHQILTSNGIKNGDVLMVHSSLSKMGYVEGGAKTLINALLKAIEPDGTLLMPSFPAVGYNYDYLIKKPVFDVLNTPSKMGIVTEVFRNYPNVKRSLHPTDSVCALGSNADYFVEEHFGQLTPYNKNSPFWKLNTSQGKILLIGVNLESLTNFHTSEDAILNFKYPIYHDKIFTTILKDKDGKSVQMLTKVHNPLMSAKRRCNEFEETFITNGIMLKFKMGEATCRLIDAFKMNEWLLANYKNGITIYTPNGKELK